jgi:hypothetical protein
MNVGGEDSGNNKTTHECYFTMLFLNLIVDFNSGYLCFSSLGANGQVRYWYYCHVTFVAIHQV